MLLNFNVPYGIRISDERVKVTMETLNETKWRSSQEWVARYRVTESWKNCRSRREELHEW